MMNMQNLPGSTPNPPDLTPDDWRIRIMQYPEELLGTILGMFLGTFPVNLLFFGNVPDRSWEWEGLFQDYE